MALRAFEGTVTLLFTDVEGSTALTSRSGDAAGRALIRDCEGLIRDQIAKHEGREIKSLGDGLMVAFTSARRAVGCAVEIQKSFQRHLMNDGPQVRIGLNAGEAIHEGDDLFGSAVNAAARIASMAKGGEILVSEVVKTLAGRVADTEFVDRGHVSLKGFEDPFRLFQVSWATQPTPLHPFEQTPFVGRKEERALLSSFLDGMEDKRGGAIVIGGEPGVGKTRLTQELAHEAVRREYRVLVGRCYESDATPPYIPFVEIIEAAMRSVAPDTLRLALGDAAGEVAKIVPQLRVMFDDIPPPLELPAEQERRYLFNSLYEFIARAASARPLVLILDDVHWADEATLLAAEHIAWRLKDIPALVLATYRDTELDISRPLARTLESLVRQQQAHRINLKRLSADDLSALLRALSGKEAPGALVTAIYGETEGNPFFAEEVFKHLSEEGRLFAEDGDWRTDVDFGELDVPESVRLVIGRRVERLAEPTRIALEIAALVGKRFEYEIVQAVAEVGPEDLLDAFEEAERAHLIVPEAVGGGTAFSFAHELIRQTLTAATALPRRQHRHLAIARALQARADESHERAGDIAAHLLHAGAWADPRETATFLGMAGRRALEAAAFEEAQRNYENALALHPDTKSKEYARLLFERGLALRPTGLFEEALEVWRQALAIYEAADERNAAGSICREIAVQLGWTGRGDEGAEWAARGLAITDGLRTADHADLLAIGGGTMAWLGVYDEAVRLVDSAIELARELDDDYVLGRALGARSLHHYFFMEFKECIDYGEQAAPFLRAAGAAWDMGAFLPVLVFAYNLTGHFDRADDLAHEVLPLCERIGHQVGSMLTLRGIELSSRVADPDGFESAARHDVDMNREHNLGWISNGYVWLGAALAWKGEWDEALATFRLGVETEVPGAFDGWAGGLLALHQARLGQTDEVVASFVADRAQLETADQKATVGTISFALALIEATWLIDRADLSGTLYPVVRQLLGRGVLYRVFDFRTMELVAALAADAAGDPVAADGHFDAALGIARAIPLPIEEADALLYRARCNLRRGADPAGNDVAPHVERATEVLTGLGMEPYLDQMKAVLSLR